MILRFRPCCIHIMRIFRQIYFSYFNFCHNSFFFFQSTIQLSENITGSWNKNVTSNKTILKGYLSWYGIDMANSVKDIIKNKNFLLKWRIKSTKFNFDSFLEALPFFFQQEKTLIDSTFFEKWRARFIHSNSFYAVTEIPSVLR